MKLFAFTLDFEADYAGVVDQYKIFNDMNKIEEVLEALSSLGVKITAYTVGEIFDSFPHVVKLFEKYGCEFEPHSYSHDFRTSDSDEEIEKSKNAYYNYFNKYPIGYRAPRGMISNDGIKSLEKHGFLYDSSIFPSYFPNPFKYLFATGDIHKYENSNIMEIPLTTVSPFKITLSISYIKLLGLRFFSGLSLPDTIIFDSHLHDLIYNKTSFMKLPLIWRLIYSRNKFRGLEYCVDFLTTVKKKGYQFCYMSEIYNEYKDRIA